MNSPQPEPILPPGQPKPPLVRAQKRNYLASRAFWRLLALIVLGAIGLLMLLLFGLLPLYTRHGATATVPEVKNSLYPAAESILSEAGMKIEVADSQYLPTLPPLTIITQDPAAGDRVKPGRSVYVVVNKAQAPTTKLPDVLEVNVQQAKYLLENWGLRIGQRKYVPGDARDLVLRASFQGKPLKPGDAVLMGSRIDLLISQGIGASEVEVPSLEGLSLGEASATLTDMGLGIGPLRYAPAPAGKAKGVVLRQRPAAGSSLLQGRSVELTLSGPKPNNAPRE